MSPGELRKIAARWLRFNAVGAIGVGVQLGMLALLTRAFGWDYLWATAAAVETAVLHNFTWHERYTWADRTQAARGPWQVFKRLAAFHAGNGAVSLVGNVLLMRLLVGGLGLPTMLANVLSIASCGLVNFLVGDRLVFRAPPPATPEQAAALAGMATAFTLESPDLAARRPAVRHAYQVALRERQEEHRGGGGEGQAEAEPGPQQQRRQRPQLVEHGQQREDAAELPPGRAQVEGDARQPV